VDIELVFQFFRGFRKRRMRFFYRHFRVEPQTTVLDIGGREFNWTLMPFAPHVTILNLSTQGTRSGKFEWVIGDARRLPFPDNAFEIVYSNSVIEHLGNLDDQRQFAAECTRVGRSYFVQTPNRNFLIEPHLLTPFVHWLPKEWQARLLRNFTLWGWITRPDDVARARFINTTRMLTRTEFQSLFPDAEIRSEHFLGLTKCFIAIKKRTPNAGALD
jgi:ubiquinone/menaquinone biosynthesis C-methylase UbiE